MQKIPERQAGPAGWSTCSSAGGPHGNHLQTCTYSRKKNQVKLTDECRITKVAY